MRSRRTAARTPRQVLLVIALAALWPTILPGQAPWTAPRTPDGQPDLQGVWINATVTSLERPADLAGKEFFASEEEARAWEQDALTRLIEPGDEAFAESGAVVPTLRTSIIIAPPDGRIPYSPEGRTRWEATPTVTRDNPTNGPEDRPLQERCILWGEGPPLLPRRNNPYLRIVQSRDHAVILTEMIHHARIVPLDGRPHVTPRVQQWVGDSRGRWEGDTLVVDTTNFTGKIEFRGATDALHVVERFTRTGADALRYEFTIEDPNAFTRPWSGETFLTRSDDLLFEYACHEGNRTMEPILTGGQMEQDARSARRASWLAAGVAVTLLVGAAGYALLRRRWRAGDQ